MNLDALNKLTDSADMLHHIERELSCLSDAFDICGNANMGQRLSVMQNDVRTARKMLEEGRNEALSHACKVSEEATQNMVRAALVSAMTVR